MRNFFARQYGKLRRRFSHVENSYVDRRTPLGKPLLLFIPALVGITLFIVVPLVLTGQDAFTVPRNLRAGIEEPYVGLRNFEVIFNNPSFLQAISNSLVYSVVTVPVSILLALVIAAVISSVVWRLFRGFLQTIFFLPYVTSSVAVAMAFGFMFAQQGLVNDVFSTNVRGLTNPDSSFNAMFVISLNGLGSSLAFDVLILTTAILGISRDRYRAASIDGAGPFKQFWTITIPGVMRGVTFLLVFGIISSIRVIPLALYQTQSAGSALSDIRAGNAQTLLFFVYEQLVSSNYNAAAAASFILLAISICFTITFRGGAYLLRILIVKGGEGFVNHRIKASKVIL